MILSTFHNCDCYLQTIFPFFSLSLSRQVVFTKFSVSKCMTACHIYVEMDKFLTNSMKKKLRTPERVAMQQSRCQPECNQNIAIDFYWHFYSEMFVHFTGFCQLAHKSMQRFSLYPSPIHCPILTSILSPKLIHTAMDLMQSEARF